MDSVSLIHFVNLPCVSLSNSNKQSFTSSSQFAKSKVESVNHLITCSSQKDKKSLFSGRMVRIPKDCNIEVVNLMIAVGEEDELEVDRSSMRRSVLEITRESEEKEVTATSEVDSTTRLEVTKFWNAFSSELLRRGR